MDHWILSRLNTLVKNVDQRMANMILQVQPESWKILLMIYLTGMYVAPESATGAQR